MKLSDKILKLRKQDGMSQEELAEKLNVSRQAFLLGGRFCAARCHKCPAVEQIIWSYCRLTSRL